MIFGVAIVIYVAIRWDDTSLAQTLALGGFGLIGAVVAAYVGGAAYEDVRNYQTDAAYVYGETEIADYGLEGEDYVER